MREEIKKKAIENRRLQQQVTAALDQIETEPEHPLQNSLSSPENSDDGHGPPVETASPMDAINLGMGMVTEDRKTQGCFLDLSVAQNISIASLQKLSNSVGVLNLRAETDMFIENRDQLDIKVSGQKQAIRKLSGGNQQKALIARWLARAPKILIVDEPTRGIDIRAKAQVQDILFALADAGTAAIVVSSELPEILTVSDQILTMSEGRISAEFSRNDANEETLMRSMTPKAQSTASIASQEDGVMI